jgi:hypothetical protein
MEISRENSLSDNGIDRAWEQRFWATYSKYYCESIDCQNTFIAFQVSCHGKATHRRLL